MGPSAGHRSRCSPARAGRATRIRLLESGPWGTKPLEEFMRRPAGSPATSQSAATRVEFENTNFLGSGKTYARFMVPGGGLMFTGYDMNHSYRDCDVFVSLAKLKEHPTAGMTLSMKNCFGNTPCTIYSQDAPQTNPAQPAVPRRRCTRALVCPQERAAGRQTGLSASTTQAIAFRASVRISSPPAPSTSAVIDGIYTMAGGEMPNWPGLDSQAGSSRPTDRRHELRLHRCRRHALMGFDPMADRGTAPFETCDSMLRLAEHLGVGSAT